MANPRDVHAIINAVAPLPVATQLELLHWLVSKDGTTNPFINDPLVNKCVTKLFIRTSLMPWCRGDDTFQEVIEALETDSVGHCDNCDKYTALRGGDASGVETHQCAFGC